jgi:hypothetical protein
MKEAKKQMQVNQVAHGYTIMGWGPPPNQAHSAMLFDPPLWIPRVN